MEKELSAEQKGIVINLREEIKDKEKRQEDLKKEIEQLKIKVKIPSKVIELIRDAMNKGTIKIKGSQKPCPVDIGYYLKKFEEEERNLKEKLGEKKEELPRAKLEIIIDYQKLIVLKKDLKE